MIRKVIIKFWSKIQIQILVQFEWRAEKVTKIKLRVLVKSFDKSHHIYALHIFGYYSVVIIKIQAS